MSFFPDYVPDALETAHQLSFFYLTLIFLINIVKNIDFINFQFKKSYSA